MEARVKQVRKVVGGGGRCAVKNWQKNAARIRGGEVTMTTPIPKKIGNVAKGS